MKPLPAYWNQQMIRALERFNKKLDYLYDRLTEGGFTIGTEPIEEETAASTESPPQPVR